MTRENQITYLMRRFGLSATQASLIAALHFGGTAQ